MASTCLCALTIMHAAVSQCVLLTLACTVSLLIKISHDFSLNLAWKAPRHSRDCSTWPGSLWGAIVPVMQALPLVEWLSDDSIVQELSNKTEPLTLQDRVILLYREEWTPEVCNICSHQNPKHSELECPLYKKCLCCNSTGCYRFNCTHTCYRTIADKELYNTTCQTPDKVWVHDMHVEGLWVQGWSGWVNQGYKGDLWWASLRLQSKSWEKTQWNSIESGNKWRQNWRVLLQPVPFI